MKVNIQKVIIVLLSLYFIFFTFLDLNWGAPFYFHPDERNIASSVVQLNLLENMNPRFFAYGQLPIFITYLAGLGQNLFSTTPRFVVSFEQAIVIARIISGLLTVALVCLIIKTTHLIRGRNAAIISFIFSTTSVAFFQFSHFGTFEIWLSVLYLLITFELYKFLESKKVINFALASLIFGISCALKLSSVVFILILFYTALLSVLQEKETVKKIFLTSKLVAILFVGSFLAYFISSPFNILDSASFIKSMTYESGVATGSINVFYTGTFMNQLPVIFQLQKILPFLINPIFLLILIPSLIFFIYLSFKEKAKSWGIFILAFLVLFASSAFLYAKWTRYIVPTIPFLFIAASVALSEIFKDKKRFNLLLVFLTVIGITFSFAFIKTVRIDQDSRIEAVEFARKNIPSNSTITSEVYDLGILPFNPIYSKISLYNFYDLDNNPEQKLTLSKALSADVLILPSQRIYESRTNNSDKFPVSSKVYSDLFSGKSSYKLIYQTPCDIFCKITYMGNPALNVEQTTNVFDRPTVYIFKKK